MKRLLLLGALAAGRARSPPPRQHLPRRDEHAPRHRDREGPLAPRARRRPAGRRGRRCSSPARVHARRHRPHRLVRYTTTAGQAPGRRQRLAQGTRTQGARAGHDRPPRGAAGGDQRRRHLPAHHAEAARRPARQLSSAESGPASVTTSRSRSRSTTTARSRAASRRHGRASDDDGSRRDGGPGHRDGPDALDGNGRRARSRSPSRPAGHVRDSAPG